MLRKIGLVFITLRFEGLEEVEPDQDLRWSSMVGKDFEAGLANLKSIAER